MIFQTHYKANEMNSNTNPYAPAQIAELPRPKLFRNLALRLVFTCFWTVVTASLSLVLFGYAMGLSFFFCALVGIEVSDFAHSWIAICASWFPLVVGGACVMLGAVGKLPGTKWIYK